MIPRLVMCMSEKRDVVLKEALLEWRKQTALKCGISTGFILQQKTVDLLVERKPLTLEALLRIYGMGESKLSCFGQEILEIIDKFLLPGERALKEYATRQSVGNLCDLCDACNSVRCPSCSVVHQFPCKELNSTTVLLHQMVNAKKAWLDVVDHKKKRKLTGAFVHAEDWKCPMRNCKRKKSEEVEGRKESSKKERGEVESVGIEEDPILDTEFWKIAAAVKRRAKRALGKKTEKKRSTKTKRKNPPDEIQQFAWSSPPDLDSCSISALKRFLHQTGCASPRGVVDGSELRALAKKLLPAWEVHRILACESLPGGLQSCAILRIKEGDGYDQMRSSFRKLSLVIHPDKNCSPEASHAFSKLQSAVEEYRCVHR